jgi:hypothetical protein
MSRGLSPVYAFEGMASLDMSRGLSPV